MTSDHYLTESDLQNVSERVQSGQAIEFDAQRVEEFSATIDELKSERGVGWFALGILALFAVGSAGAIYWIAKLLF